MDGTEVGGAHADRAAAGPTSRYALGGGGSRRTLAVAGSGSRSDPLRDQRSRDRWLTPVATVQEVRPRDTRVARSLRRLERRCRCSHGRDRAPGDGVAGGGRGGGGSPALLLTPPPQ